MIIYNYIITNLLNNKQYVGMHTICNEEKTDYYFGGGTFLRKAVKKYGKNNFKKEIICICNNVIEAYKNEGLFIKKYNTLAPNGYNINPSGGLTAQGPMSDSVRKKISISKKNKPSTRKNYHHPEYVKDLKRKPILQYSKQGEFIKEWNSAKYAAQELKITNNITACCIGHRNTTGGYMWKYKDVNYNYNNIIENKNKRVSSKKPILQYDINNNFIMEFESITAASKYYNISDGNLCSVLKNKRKHTNGCIWRYKNNY